MGNIFGSAPEKKVRSSRADDVSESESDYSDGEDVGVTTQDTMTSTYKQHTTKPPCEKCNNGKKSKYHKRHQRTQKTLTAWGAGPVEATPFTAQEQAYNTLPPPRMGTDYHSPGGFLGSYVPYQHTLDGADPSHSYWSQRPEPYNFPSSVHTHTVGSKGIDFSEAFGIDTRAAATPYGDAGSGYDNIKIEAPQDYLYADQFDPIPEVLTSNKNQSRDLRGEPAVSPVFTADGEGGIFGGHLQTDLGPYGVVVPIRKYIV